MSFGKGGSNTPPTPASTGVVAPPPPPNPPMFGSDAKGQNSQRSKSLVNQGYAGTVLGNLSQAGVNTSSGFGKLADIGFKSLLGN